MATPDDTRRSWDQATRNHNAHKGDQAALLRAGQDPLFPEELALLGPIAGRTVAHLQCNAGQDTLGLVRRGADVTGVDFSPEAIRFARELSVGTGIAATFELSEIVAWLHATPRRFDLAFASYGTYGWLPDLDAWAQGIARILLPGGAFTCVEFHPLVWSFDAAGDRRGDDYFHRGPYVAPVGDYVAQSGAGLGAHDGRGPLENPIAATSWQYGLGELLTALAAAGLRIERLVEWPFANGCRVNASLVEAPGRRWVWPPGVAPIPLQFGVVARKPAV